MILEQVETLSTDRTSREAELLLCCARTFISPPIGERIKTLVQNGVDWTRVTNLARRHGVLPLLYRSLSISCPDTVPADILEALCQRFRTNAVGNTLLSEELVRLLSVFETHGILAVPYKGPALAISIYKSLSLRKSGDLDILIFKRDIPKARQLLISEGYRPELTDSAKESALRSDYHLKFVHTARGILVELHWAFTFDYWHFQIDLEQIRERLESVQLAGRAVPTIPRQELLLILCTHGAKHFWWHLVWVCDVAEFLRGDPLDWDGLLAHVERLRFRRILYLGLFMAKDLLNAPLPEEVWKEIQRDKVIPSLASDAIAHQFSSDLTRALDKQTFYLRTRESIRDRVRYFYCDHFHGYLAAVRNVPVPNTTDQRLLPVPAAFHFLHYFFRPLRLAAVYGLRLPILLLKYLLAW